MAASLRGMDGVNIDMSDLGQVVKKQIEDQLVQSDMLLWPIPLGFANSTSNNYRARKTINVAAAGSNSVGVSCVDVGSEVFISKVDAQGRGGKAGLVVGMCVHTADNVAAADVTFASTDAVSVDVSYEPQRYVMRCVTVWNWFGECVGGRTSAAPDACMLVWVALVGGVMCC